MLFITYSLLMRNGIGNIPLMELAKMTIKVVEDYPVDYKEIETLLKQKWFQANVHKFYFTVEINLNYVYHVYLNYNQYKKDMNEQDFQQIITNAKEILQKCKNITGKISEGYLRTISYERGIYYQGLLDYRSGDYSSCINNLEKIATDSTYKNYADLSMAQAYMAQACIENENINKRNKDLLRSLELIKAVIDMREIKFGLNGRTSNAYYIYAKMLLKASNIDEEQRRKFLEEAAQQIKKAIEILQSLGAPEPETYSVLLHDIQAASVNL